MKRVEEEEEEERQGRKVRLRKDWRDKEKVIERQRKRGR